MVKEMEWLTLSRLGQEIRQEVTETARKGPDGRLSFHWRLLLSADPFEGEAAWSPATPGVLSLRPTRGAALEKAVPQGALLWPEDLDRQLKDAARDLRPIQVTTFSFPVQQWSQLSLVPTGAAPLPGFPDAVRFTGHEQQGAASAPVEVWVSPQAGELKHRGELGSLIVLSQRMELPPPQAEAGAPGFFERTLQHLPPHPFQPWLQDLTLRAEGAPPNLPEDAQQMRLPGGRWRLRQAALPTGPELTQLPVQGTPSAADAPFLAPTPLVPYQDPAFAGLLHRMALPPGQSRWDLAQRVTSFVFEWITAKDFSVGFASALEVCRNPRGDCTEHGVLAVALLRKLGVPTRGVTGWVALGETLGLHFWVEVRLMNRWVPVDPTFDQAPASAFRLKLGDTDLADLGTLGWDGAAVAFSGVHWVPEREGEQAWPKPLDTNQEVLTTPGGLRLRLPGARWVLQDGRVRLKGSAIHGWFTAVTRPGEAQLRGSHKLAGPNSLRAGWWLPSTRELWMDLGNRKWIRWTDLSEADAFHLLDQLIVRAPPS